MLMDFLYGLLNGLTAWPLLLLHIFGLLSQYPVYDIARNTGWYQFGFLIGAGSPILGFLGKRRS
jgi:hypothetical protein